MTELVFILDRSGSMAGLEADTVGGFNSMIARQKQEAGQALVSTVLFNHDSVIIHDRLPLSEVPPMTEREYRTGGSTALLDALGGAIRTLSASTNTPAARTCLKRRCSSSPPTATRIQAPVTAMKRCEA